MKTGYKQILGASLLSLGLSLSLANRSNVQAASLSSTALDCSAAAEVFQPAYSDCRGAYNSNSSTSRQDSNSPERLATNLLNEDKIFGSGGWISLGKQDLGKEDEVDSRFSILTDDKNRTTGSISFDIDKINAFIEADYKEKGLPFDNLTFTRNFNVVVSLKSSTAISLYKWDAPIWGDVVTEPSTIKWATAGVSVNNNPDPNKRQPQGLSNVTVFIQQKEIPEPSMMLGLGFMSVGLLIKKNKLSKS
ncbi:PEP-CTERM sorting domain-containing protein [Cyanobacterium sp. IPPAS B-1200]|uniref:PEP-CTERM sorting domain-containing protein n=1 Tax=Cyanobacterium sp. IPPAS B-1200 TaxID=1562720 RepID=UPI0008524EBD|nr:PEP-CTERM sorting domain-containing protein [Cyanobacterium sp. IPPAS B-1200]OEJ78487.1 hypothetical protein A5482_12870 [Cyanobacterium sp. IPPAS B-1200]